MPVNEKSISIDAGTDENTYSKSVSLKIADNADSGIYPVTAYVYADNGRLQDTKTIELKIEDCPSFLKEGREAVLTGSQPAAETQAIKEQMPAPTTKISFSEEDRMMMLVLSTFVFAVFFVFMAIILFITV